MSAFVLHCSGPAGLIRAPRSASLPVPKAARFNRTPGATLQSSVGYGLVPAGEELYVTFVPERPTERTTNGEPLPITVDIENARNRSEPFKLHEHGFTLANLEVPTLDWKNEDQIKEQYYPVALQLVKDLSGATRVHPLEHIIRRGRVKTGDEDGKPGEPATMGPTNGLHVDFTTESGPLRLAWALPEEADELKQKRFAIIQVWRPIVGPVEESPLTFVDVNSVNEQDFIYGRLDLPADRHSSFYSLHPNPDHKFYYYKGMTTSEAAVFKCYDSRSQGTASGFTPHCAFDDPTTPETAPERYSIEFRALAFFEDQP